MTRPQLWQLAEFHVNKFGIPSAFIWPACFGRGGLAQSIASKGQKNCGFWSGSADLLRVEHRVNQLQQLPNSFASSGLFAILGLPWLLPTIDSSMVSSEDHMADFSFRSQWKQRVGQPSEAVAIYLDRIQKIKREEPHLLIAHAYTQHMAILAGGQMLRRSVRSSMQLGPGDPGTAIFELQVITDIYEDHTAPRQLIAVWNNVAHGQDWIACHGRIFGVACLSFQSFALHFWDTAMITFLVFRSLQKPWKWTTKLSWRK